MAQIDKKEKLQIKLLLIIFNVLTRYSASDELKKAVSDFSEALNNAD